MHHALLAASWSNEWMHPRVALGMLRRTARRMKPITRMLLCEYVIHAIKLREKAIPGAEHLLHLIQRLRDALLLGRDTNVALYATSVRSIASSSGLEAWQLIIPREWFTRDSSLTFSATQHEYLHDSVATIPQIAYMAAMYCCLETGTTAQNVDVLLYGAALCEKVAAIRPRARKEEQQQQLHTAFDIIGNPFKRLTPLPLERENANVRAMAKAIQKEERFQDMPVLADALEDVGCSDHDILEHCRNSPHQHFKGCWVLRRLLGVGIKGDKQHVGMASC